MEIAELAHQVLPREQRWLAKRKPRVATRPKRRILDEITAHKYGLALPSVSEDTKELLRLCRNGRLFAGDPYRFGLDECAEACAAGGVR
jgi:hypothetical protein